MSIDDLATVLERARTHATVSMADVSTLTGRSLNRLYEDVRRDGRAVGITVLRLSAKSVRMPSAPLLRLLQIDDDTETP